MSLRRDREMYQSKLYYHKKNRNCQFNEWQIRFKRERKRAVKRKEFQFAILSYKD